MRKTRTITPTEMREINRAAILDLIRRESPISRSAIAEKLEVSLPTVMRIIEGLVAEELVRSLGVSEWSGGRRRLLLEFNGSSQVMIGVDLSGGDMYAAAANLTGTVLAERTAPRGQAREEEAYQQLVKLLESLLEEMTAVGQRVRGIGVGAPGITDYVQGVVHWAPVFGWSDFPLRQRLAEQFSLPVIVDNDVNLAALGEIWFGSEQNADSLVVISIGSGIGAGIVLDGVIYRGNHQAAGEIGYLLPGREFLGKTYQAFGALENITAEAGILNRARGLLTERRSAAAVETLRIADVFTAYEAGEDWAVEVINETIDCLAMAVCSISLCLDPEVIILGGELVDYLAVLVEPLLERVRGVLPAIPRIAASQLGRRAAVMGAITNVLYQTGDYYILRSMA